MKRLVCLGLTTMSWVAACGGEDADTNPVLGPTVTTPSVGPTTGLPSSSPTSTGGPTSSVNPTGEPTNGSTAGPTAAPSGTSGGTTTGPAITPIDPPENTTTGPAVNPPTPGSSTEPATPPPSSTSETTPPTTPDPTSPSSSETITPAPDTETSGPSEPNAGCGGAAVCDDFESGLGAWEIQPNSTPAPVVDSSKGANGSSSSLKVQGSSQQSFVAVAVPGQSFFFRAYMNFEQSTEQMNGHGWFVVGADNLTQGDEQQMRFGSSGNHGHKEIDFNVYGGSCGGEKTQFSDGGSDGAAGWNNTPHPTYQFSAGTWYCVEGHFNGPGNEFQLWVNSEEVPGLHVTASTMCANWSPTYTHVKFGAGANSEIGAIWYDDVAVSTQRIGCL